MRWDGPAPLQSGNAELQGKLYLQTIATFRCKTQTIDSVFIRGGDVGTRPNAPISLTIGAVIRDREGAARIRSARYAAHAVSLLGGTMVRRAYRQRSLVEVLLPDGDKLWDSTLRRIDTVLDDDVLIDRVAEALARRHPQSRRRGRLGTPATVVLRMLVLKHLSDWSFDECEREVRGSLVYRAFCRIDGKRVPDAKTLIRLAHLLDEPVLKDILAQLVMRGRERRVIQGRRLRRSSKPTFTTRRTPHCWLTGCACSRARCGGSASRSGSAPAPSAAGSSRSRSAVAPPAPA